MTDSPQELAERIARLEEIILRGRVPQLGHSSFEGGGITQYSSDGETVISRLGEQFDGTGGVAQFNGPPPPTPKWPSNPVQEGLSSLTVRWEGEFEPYENVDEPVVAPMNFSHIEFHSSTDPNFTGLFGETLRAATTSARGGEVIITTPPGQAYYLRMVARNTAGQKSVPSVPIGPFSPLDVGDYTGTTVWYGPADPDAANDIQVGDLWLKEVSAGPPPEYETYRRVPGDTWALLADQGASNALASAIAAQTTADAKAKVFSQAAMPTWTGAAGSAVWYDTDDGNRIYTFDGTTFVSRRLGNGAIQPASLIASDVFVTGTVTAALLESILVLTSLIIAGDQNGTHVRITPTGVYVFTADAVDGVPNEVIRMGTSSNDFFGITSSTGVLQLSLDNTGAVNARTGNFREDITIRGTPLSDWLTRIPGGGGADTAHPGGRNYVGWQPTAAINGVTSEIGLIEMSVTLEKGRIYWAIPSIYWTRSANTTYLDVKVRDGGVNAPTISSSLVTQDFFSGGDNPAWTLNAERHRPFRVSTTGIHRLLLTVAPGGGGNISVVNGNVGDPMLSIIDLGPDYGNPAMTNRGGGSTPVPTQQYYWEATPAGWRTFRGDGTERFDTAGSIVQGWDPSGFNGDGGGFAWFTLPSITGTVDRVDVSMYWNHWYWNGGGTAIINLLSGTAGSNFEVNKTQGSNLLVGGIPKPGGRTVTLPSTWWPFFRNVGTNGSNRTSTVSFGRAGTTDETYYGKLSVSDLWLRIWYTQ